MLAARERRHDPARVALREIGLAVLGVRPRDRPLEPGARHRIAQDVPLGLDQVQRLVGVVGAAGVGVGACEQHAEAHGQPGVARLCPRLVECRAEHLDGTAHPAQSRVRPSERLVQRRSRAARRRHRRRARSPARTAARPRRRGGPRPRDGRAPRAAGSRPGGRRSGGRRRAARRTSSAAVSSPIRAASSRSSRRVSGIRVRMSRPPRSSSVTPSLSARSAMTVTEGCAGRARPETGIRASSPGRQSGGATVRAAGAGRGSCGRRRPGRRRGRRGAGRRP